MSHFGLYFTVGSLYFDDAKYEALSDGAKVLWCLAPDAGLIWGIKVLLALENKAVGLSFSNLFTTIENDPISMGLVWLMFLLDIFIYSLIISYIDAVKPGEFGSAKKWYFPFLVSKCSLKYPNLLLFYAFCPRVWYSPVPGCVALKRTTKLMSQNR